MPSGVSSWFALTRRVPIRRSRNGGAFTVQAPPEQPPGEDEIRSAVVD